MKLGIKTETAFGDKLGSVVLLSSYEQTQPGPSQHNWIPVCNCLGKTIAQPRSPRPTPASTKTLAIDWQKWNLAYDPSKHLTPWAENHKFERSHVWGCSYRLSCQADGRPCWCPETTALVWQEWLDLLTLVKLATTPRIRLGYQQPK